MPKKISDLTAISSLVSADYVEISRNATSSVKRDLYDEFSDNLENAGGLLWNVGVNATVAASALTIFLTQKDGSSNPSTSINRSRISYHSTTASVGGYVIVDSIATTSTVISAGSTGGSVSGSPVNIFVYALNNAGATEIGWITGRTLDETILHTSTAEGGAGAADSRGVFYSTTARSNVAVRLIGVITATEATSGTWSTAPTVISSVNIDESHFLHTWTSTITAASGTITTVGTVTARFKTEGNICYYRITFRITTNGTGGGAVVATMPFTSKNITSGFLTPSSGVRSDGKMLVVDINNNASTATIRLYDATYPGADGTDYSISGWYEMTDI